MVSAFRPRFCQADDTGRILLARYQARHHVVALTCGNNIGAHPSFPWPMDFSPVDSAFVPPWRYCVFTGRESNSLRKLYDLRHSEGRRLELRSLLPIHLKQTTLPLVRFTQSLLRSGCYPAADHLGHWQEILAKSSLSATPTGIAAAYGDSPLGDQFGLHSLADFGAAANQR
jgi:hypothetical protein